MDADTKRKLKSFLYESMADPKIGWDVDALTDRAWDLDLDAGYGEIERLAAEVVAQAQADYNRKGED